MRAALSLLLAFLAGPALAAEPQLMLAQRFTLSQPHSYTWLADAPRITEGTIVVVRVSPDDARVRQVGGPVLYVGPVPAERVNNGARDGVVIGFVPGHIDLRLTPVYWGPPTLPERVDAESGAAALAAASATAPSAEVVRRALQPRARLEDTPALYRHLADLIDAYAPGEAERARGYRVGAQ